MRVGHTIYFDHQATTPVDSKVLQEMVPHFAESFGNPHSVDHTLGWSAAQALEQATARIADFIGTDPDEIVFTSGATEANNLALLGFGRRAAGGKRRRILIGATEHKCVMAASRILQRQLGYQVELVPVDSEGRIVIPAFKTALNDDVLLVSIMAVNNEIGTIQDCEQLSALAKSRGAYFHCDAAQAPGAIDMRSITEHVDTLSLSAHKMYGPKGIGVLFIRRELQNHIEPLVYGGGQQRNLRSGTVPVPLCVGMGAAAALLDMAEAEQTRASLRRRRDRFVERLLALPWPVTLNGPQAKDRHPGNANMRFDGFSASDILSALQPRLAASTGSACTSGISEPSHVLSAIGLADEQADASIRFSLGFHTTDTDIDEATDLIAAVLSRLADSGSSAHAKTQHDATPKTDTLAQVLPSVTRAGTG